MIVGVDIGGTKTEVVVLDEKFKVLRRHKVATGIGSVELVKSTIDAVAKALGEDLLASEVHSIGIGVPGKIVDGTINNAENLEITSLNLSEELQSHWGIKPVLVNDVNAAAVGYWRLKNYQRGMLAYLNLGTGLAAGLVVNGEIWRGATGVAGELGYISVDPNGPEDRHGLRGCLETYASSSGLAIQTGKSMHEARQIVTKYEDIREQMYFAVANAIRILSLTYDPDAIVIGGGLTALDLALEESIAKIVTEWEEQSPFLKSVNMLERVHITLPNVPAAAIGAALLGAENG